MANKAFMQYEEKDSFVHNLSGTTKLIGFLALSIVTMLTYDTRVLIGLLVLCFIIFRLSKINFKEVKNMFYFIYGFVLFNTILIFLFSPMYGVEIYGTQHDLITFFGRYTLTQETLFYLFNNSMKYLMAAPLAIIFLTTTSPSEFASSLESVGVPTKVAYSFSLALRYIPDVQKDYKEISKAQMAKGVQLDKKSKLSVRIKNSIKILLPLILTSLDRIEVISNAMELRRFGKNKKRTWINKKKMNKNDILSIVFIHILVVVSMLITYSNGTRFYNPFV